MLTIFKFIRSARTKVQRRNAQTYEIGWENALKDCRELNLDQIEALTVAKPWPVDDSSHYQRGYRDGCFHVARMVRLRTALNPARGSNPSPAGSRSHG